MPRTKEGALKVNERYSIREIQNEIVANPVCPGCGEPISEDNTLIISTPHEILVPTKMDQDGYVQEPDLSEIDLREVESILRDEEPEEGFIDGCEKCR